MTKIWVVLKREVLSAFVTPVAYMAVAALLLLGGYFFLTHLSLFNWMVLRYDSISSGLGVKPINANELIVEKFWQNVLVLLVLIVPLLSMRSLAEDRRSGVLDFTLTLPVSVTQVVVGKFLGLMFILGLGLGLLSIYPALLLFVGAVNPELPPTLSGLLGIFLCACFFVSITMVFSALTESQTVAAVSSLVALLVMVLLANVADKVPTAWRGLILGLSPTPYLENMIGGVIELSAILYFVSFTLIGLRLTVYLLSENYR